MLGTLADQDAGKRGLFVDFFGRPASTHKAIALLALQYRVPLIVLLTRNLGKPLHCRVEVEDLILPEHYEGQPDAVRAVTQRFTAALERGVSRAQATILLAAPPLEARADKVFPPGRLMASGFIDY